MQAKPVQIAVIVIGLIVGVVGIFLAVSSNSGPDLANKMVFVDVKTGELFAVPSRGRSVLIPYRNPDTQERTLLPAVFDQDTSEWQLNRRYMGELDVIEGIHGSINVETGRVSIAEDTKPRNID